MKQNPKFRLSLSVEEAELLYSVLEKNSVATELQSRLKLFLFKAKEGMTTPAYIETGVATYSNKLGMVDEALKLGTLTEEEEDKLFTAEFQRLQAEGK